MEQNNDKQLLIRIKRGDKESFDKFFEMHYSRCLSFARGLLKDADAAEDLVQNVFIRLWLFRKKIDVDKSMINMLMVCLRNEAFNYMRNAYNARRLKVDIAEKVDDVDALQSSDLQELHNILLKYVEQMPPQRRLIFKLCKIEHLTYAEIAAILDISARTVEKHMELAIRDLRKISRNL